MGERGGIIVFKLRRYNASLYRLKAEKKDTWLHDCVFVCFLGLDLMPRMM